MAEKTTIHYFKTGEFWKLEETLNAESSNGWQVVRPGRLRQKYTRDEGAVYHHRFGYCPMSEGSADYITYTAAAARSGWEIVARKNGWILFRKRNADADEQLPDERSPIIALYEKRIKRCESLRIWFIVLAAAALIGGYVTDMIYIIYASVLPLFAALLLTYRVRFMQVGMTH